MYVHGYHIDNVLNVYRKQLSQRTRAKEAGASQPASSTDRVSLSVESQHQAIFNQVTADIVKRISEYSLENRFDDGLEHEYDAAGPDYEENASDIEAKFTYTLIDENNHKKTNVLELTGDGPFSARKG